MLVWLDESGRVTRAALNGTAGDAQKDAAAERTVRAQLFTAPVPGTPMPVKVMISAR